mmetsp:Transcript_4650/g.7547  ORF Transcript_4650/g.7547 Transcript_4650/m.7547 type:complete len:638 (+) Transcript_4650:79-1992(+)
MEDGKTGRPVTEVSHSELPLLCVWNDLDGIDDSVPFGPRDERPSPPCCSNWLQIAGAATVFEIFCSIGLLAHLFSTEPGVLVEVTTTLLLIAFGSHVGGFALGRLTAPILKRVNGPSLASVTTVEALPEQELEDKLLTMKSQGVDDNGWLGEYLDEDAPVETGWTRTRHKGTPTVNFSKTVTLDSATIEKSVALISEKSVALSSVRSLGGESKFDFESRTSLQMDDDVKDVLSELTWNFDTFAYGTMPCVQGKPILTLGIHLMEECDLVASIPDWMLNQEVVNYSPEEELGDRVLRFLQELDRKYIATNPYHNGIHACDVMKNIKCFFEAEKIKYLMSCREWVFFISIIAAAIHDMGHTGQTNNYHIAARTDLALRYNDKSPLEQMHVSLAFQLMKDKPGTDWFGAFLKDIRIVEKNKTMPIQSRFRRTLISMVLATDNLVHNECCQRLGALIAVENVNELLKSDSETQLLVLETLLHAADISHPTYDLPLHVAWSSLVLEEFWLQGDLEKQVLGAASMPMFDRDKMDCPGAQIGFFKFVAMGLWEPLAIFLPEMESRLQKMNQNLKFWQKNKDLGLLSVPTKEEAIRLSVGYSSTRSSQSSGDDERRFASKHSTGTSARGSLKPGNSPRILTPRSR